MNEVNTNSNKRRESLGQFDKNMVDILEINLALESYEDDTGEPMSEEELKVYADLRLLKEQKKDLSEEEKINISGNILFRLNKVLDKIGRDKFVFYDNGVINYVYQHLNERKN